ncbi:MAG: amidohydrolase [Actinomycetota bacterium]
MGVSSWFSLGPTIARDGSNPADMVVVNADVFTSDEKNPRAQALAAKDGRLVFVGEDAGVADFLGPETRLIDAGGKTVTPGFIDNHCHVVWVGGLMALMTKRLFEATSLEEVNEMVLDHARANPDIPVVMGVGWRFEHMPGGIPTMEMLDSVIRDRPVMLMSLCGQCGWFNTAAVELMEERNPAALRRLAPKKSQSGSYIGTLDHFHSFSPLDFFGEEEMKPLFETAVPEEIARVMDEAVSVGVTAMDDVQFYRSFVPYVLQYREMGIFDKVRLRGALYVDAHDLEDEPRLREDLEWWTGLAAESDHRLALGRSIKLYIDGTQGNHTAFFLEPYSDDPDCLGRPDWSQEDFDRIVGLVDGLGLQACTHACGDAGIRRALNSYERAMKENGERDARHRLEHCELPTEEDIERMAALGVHAAMQPTHFFGDETVEKVLGPARRQRYHPWRSLEKAGVVLSFGSDWCNSPLNPVYGLIVSATRMNYKGTRDWGPDQKIDLEDGIRHWTIDSARALKMDEDIGSLEVGKRADFVLFNTSPLKLTSWWFLLTHKVELGELDDFVDMTVVGGVAVYEKEGTKH